MSLWQHQRDGVEAALKGIEEYGGAGLWHGMGAGKTVTALEVVRRSGAKRVLVVGPKATLDPSVWERDAPRVFGRDTPPILNLYAGDTKKKAERLATFGDGIVTVGWASFWREPLWGVIKSRSWDVVVGDEVHRAKSAQGVASKKMGELARLVPARLGLSGTPLPHDPLDAWAIYRFLAPSIFPRTLTQMRQRYTRPALRSEYRDADVLVTTERGGALVFHKLRDLDDLERKMYRIAHRVRTEDVVDLPPYEDRTVGVTLEPAARKVYRDMEHDLIAQVRGGTVTAANAAIRVLRLQQITGGWLHEEDEQGARTGTALRVSEAKEKALADFLADVGDEPVVVFGRFHTDLDSVHEAARAAGMTSVELSGRATQLDEWQRGEAQVLAVQVQSGSEGIDLTRSRICVYYSLDYNWATWQQSRARVLRPGQSRAVQYVHLVVESSIDQMVLDALHRRGDVISQIVERLGS